MKIGLIFSILIFMSKEIVAVFPCMPLCDPDVTYAMGKQRDTIKDRMDDFKSVVVANTKQTENQTLIIDQEILSYRRLLARVTKEAMLLKKASHISTTIKRNSAINIAIKAGE
jgi:hypothetical protein